MYVIKFLAMLTKRAYFELAVILFLTVSTPTFAVEITDLYQASAEVKSQAKRDRQRAIKTAMANVLVKVSGQKNIDEKAIFKQAISRPEQYYLQYRYENVNDIPMLVVDFNQEKINQLFKTSKEPMWGSLRPQTLLWLVEEKSLSRHIVGSSADNPLVSQIKRLAKARGLPVILPLMDLDDIQSMSTAELWGRFSDPILAASTRYQAEKIVIMRVSNHSLPAQLPADDNCLVCQTNIAIDWSIIEGKQTFSSLYQASTADELMPNIIDDITDHIYQQYALSTETVQEVVIDVSNIKTLTHYANVYDFLAGLSSVESVLLVSAKGENRRFNLRVLGSTASLMASIKLSRQLEQVIDPLADIQPDDIPEFLWVN